MEEVQSAKCKVQNEDKTSSFCILHFAFCTLLTGVPGIGCYLLAGNSLDLLIGGVFLSALLVPPMAAIAGRLSGAGVCCLGLTVGLGCSWIMLVHEGAISSFQWLDCLITLLSFCLLLAAGVSLLIQLRLAKSVAVTIVTLLAIAWLTWPIWLSGAVSGGRLRWSVALHPILSINGVVPQLGIWTEQQVAYSLTNLGQDVQYQLPTSPWPLVGLQLGLTIVVLLYIKFIAPRSMNQMETAASRVSSK